MNWKKIKDMNVRRGLEKVFKETLNKNCFFILIFTCCFGGVQSQKLSENGYLGNIFAEVDSILSAPQINDIKPYIGISAANSNGSSRLSMAYTDAVIKAGGLPVIIPVTTDSEVLNQLVKNLDGVIFSGGLDVAPEAYGEDSITCTLDVDRLRDTYELKLLKLAIDRNLPILGVCRGQQLINVAFGGTLFQDIPEQHPESDIAHMQQQERTETTHTVNVYPGTCLHGIMLQESVVGVNSFHHQAVKDVAPGFVVAAVAPDGIVEAIESFPNRSILAVQWHPELLTADSTGRMLNVFRHFVKEASIFMHAKSLHKHILSVDTHVDTPLNFKPGFNLAFRDSSQVNLPKMQEGYLDAVFMAAYQRQGDRDALSSQKAVDKVDTMISGIYEQIAMNSDVCGLAFTPADLVKLKNEGKKAILIGIENGYGIGKDITNLERFKSLGVNYMTLCHNLNNDICDTSKSGVAAEWNGLSPYGKKVVKEMNRLGMIIDLAHVSDQTFWDVIELSEQPVVSTHSSVRALYGHERNLLDNQLKALAKKGGVVQLCPVDEFLNVNLKDASLADFMNHVDHAVRVAGIDHVGIGSDFDGGGGVIGLNGANDLINITVQLIKRGYSDTDIEKIWGGNFLRVMEQVQQEALQNKSNGSVNIPKK